jgi:L-fucose mutarotase/ribose pyranase (RbsD/FucU family)
MLERLGLLLGGRRSALLRSTGHGEIALVDANFPTRKALPVVARLLRSNLPPKNGVGPPGEVAR